MKRVKEFNAEKTKRHTKRELEALKEREEFLRNNRNGVFGSIF